MTLSSFATKLLSFFLVPLYTSVLTTGEYGTYDLFTATVSILLPILTLNVQEGVLRFALEKNSNYEALVSIGLRYVLIATGIVATGLVLLLCFGLFPLSGVYAGYFLLMFLVQAFAGLAINYARGSDHVQELSVSSVVSSAVTIVLNIVFLLPLHMGLDGYFLANIIGPFVQVAYLAFALRVHRDIHLCKGYDSQEKEVLTYSKPLIADSIAWWVNSLSDRYIVIFFCGIAANGIYSIAGKIPSILSIFQIIFNQAWVLSAVKDFDPEDKDGFFSDTYAVYNCCMTCICSAIIVADKPLARFLYASDFYEAWQYVPWLTVAFLFGALSSYFGGLFAAAKDSKEFARSTSIGAVANVALNLAFVPLAGPLGAAMATTICYMLIWGVRFSHSKKYIRLHVNLRRDIAAYVLLIVQSAAVLVICEPVPLYASLTIMLFAIIVLYNREIRIAGRKLFGGSQDEQRSCGL